MPNSVPERPHLPAPSTKDHSTNSWGLSVISTLLELFQQIGHRLNGSIHKDGEVAMEAPLFLGSFEEADLPDAAEYEGAVLYVSDGAAGTKYRGSDGTNWVALDAAVSGSRELLTANRTYYVRTDGSDSNDGLTDSAGGAFLTIQHAVDVVASLDLGLYDVTIQVGDGTYNEDVETKSIVGSGQVNVIGDQVTPSNVVINAIGLCFGSLEGFTGLYHIAGFRLTGGTHGLRIIGQGNIHFEDIDFGALSGRQIETIFPAAVIQATGDYSISGGSVYHVRCVSGGVVSANNRTVTLSGTPAFSTAFAEVSTLASLSASGMTFSGSATGKRYNVALNSVINTGGGGATYFPGDAAGTVATGGQYA